MQITEDMKKPLNFGTKRFDYGVHKVKIMTFEVGQTQNDKVFVEAFFCDPADEEREDSARVWFTTDKAAHFSFQVLRSILVHNTPEAKKVAVGLEFDKCATLADVVKLLNAHVVGKEMWFSRYIDPQRTYTGADGRTYQSTNKNIYGWEPDHNPNLMPQKQQEDVVQEVFPGATDANDSDGWLG